MILQTYINPITGESVQFEPGRQLADNFIEAVATCNTTFYRTGKVPFACYHVSSIREADEEEIELYIKIKFNFHNQAN